MKSCFHHFLHDCYYAFYGHIVVYYLNLIPFAGFGLVKVDTRLPKFSIKALYQNVLHTVSLSVKQTVKIHHLSI